MTAKEMTKSLIKKMEQTKKLGDVILRMSEMEQEEYWEIESQIQDLVISLATKIELLEIELM